MITVDQLAILTTFTAPALTQAIRRSGYDQPEFTTSRFVGLATGTRFCYLVTYVEEISLMTMVFLTWDPVSNQITADY